MWDRRTPITLANADRDIEKLRRPILRPRVWLARAAACVLEPLEQRVFLSGNGLAVTYWNNASSTYSNSLNFSGSSVSRIDPAVNFDWGSGSPNAAIQPDTFSARWTGQIAIPTTATYTFYVNSDDGAKLWVNGVLLIDSWRNPSGAERSGSITLTGGQRYDVRLEYYENTKSAQCQLRWSSSSIAKTIVPQSVLYSTAVPKPPARLVATATTPTQVNLTWVDGSTNEDGFAILRSTDGTNFLQAATVPANVAAYSDSDLVGGTRYYYRVQAYNIAGTSSYAAGDAATPLPPTAVPDPPTDLVVSASSSNQLALKWTDNSANEDGFAILRSTDGTDFVQVGTAAADATSYVDAGLADGVTYWYQVRSFNVLGPSTDADVSAATPLAGAGALSARAVLSTQINLAWTDLSTSETGYQVLRSDDGGGTFTLLAALPANSSSYSDANLLPSTTYIYQVATTGLSGDAAPAQVLVATPAHDVPAPPVAGNWALTFADEFNTAPAAPTWVQTIWGLTKTGSSELETYRSSAVTVNNGILNLTATQDTAAKKHSSATYTSGMINTGGIAGKTAPGYAFTYGYIEASIKVPKGQGLWPAFWMLPAPTPSGQYHDGDGEIDIMEFLGQQPTIDQIHLHHGSVWGTAYNTGVDLSQGFHTYGLDWEPDHITWYLDGKAIYTHVGDSPAVPEYIILNLAVGGNWPGAPDGTTPFPAIMQVDYVHVFQLAPSS